MKQNECTIDRLREKLSLLMDEKNYRCLTMDELKTSSIHFETVIDKNDMEDVFMTLYFLCTDGLCKYIMSYSTVFDYYLEYPTLIKKVEQNELDGLAHLYHDKKKELEAMDRIFESQKIRGLFAKLKASK